MPLVGVHPTVGHQAHQVQAAAGLPQGVHSPNKLLLLEEVPVLDGFGDAGQFLVHDAARADIQVPHLGIAHLPLGQAYVQAGGADAGMGKAGQQRSRFGVPPFHRMALPSAWYRYPTRP